MAALFERERFVISKHLRNVFTAGELAIISVCYRVNSERGVPFRQWATHVLRQHLVAGYTLDRAKLAERGVDEAQQAIVLRARTQPNRPAGRDALPRYSPGLAPVQRRKAR